MNAAAKLSGHKSYLALQATATFLAVALVTISWASTTNASQDLLGLMRNVFILLLIPILAILVNAQPRAIGGIVVMFAGISALGVYSLTSLRVFAPGAEDALSEHVIWILLSSAIAAILYLSPRNRAVIPDSVVRMYILLAVVIVAVSVILGGLQIGGVPRFVYDFVTIEGSKLAYSQGISKFYGLAAVFAALQVTREECRLSRKVVSSGLLICFLFLSLIGGGRGDFVVALSLSLIALGSVRLILMAVAGVFVNLILRSQVLELITNYSILEYRYAELGSSWSIRGKLLADSFALMADKPICTLFGCGIGYFQYHYGYAPGLYPHNIPAEWLISFGAWITLPVFVLVSLGLTQIYRFEGFRSNLIFVFLFFLGVSLKSGSVLTSYLLVGIAAFLCLKGLIQFRQGTRYKEILN